MLGQGILGAGVLGLGDPGVGDLGVGDPGDGDPGEGRKGQWWTMGWSSPGGDGVDGFVSPKLTFSKHAKYPTSGCAACHGNPAKGSGVSCFTCTLHHGIVQRGCNWSACLLRPFSR